MVNLLKVTKQIFKRKELIFVILITFFFTILPLVFGIVETLGIFKQGKCIDLIQSGANLTFCNITSVKYPNSSTAMPEASMTKKGTEYNYTFCNTTTLGTYIINGFCSNNTEDVVWAYDFKVTPSGIEATVPKGVLSIGILLSVFVLMFFFGWLSFKFMESDKTFPIGLFFLLIALIFSVYGLYLGYIYSEDYLYSNVSDVQSKIFIGVMFGLIGITFLGLLLLLIKAIREIKERKSLQKYGEGYDTQTGTYR